MKIEAWRANGPNKKFIGVYPLSFLKRKGYSLKDFKDDKLVVGNSIFLLKPDKEAFLDKKLMQKIKKIAEMGKDKIVRRGTTMDVEKYYQTRNERPMVEFVRNKLRYGMDDEDIIASLMYNWEIDMKKAKEVLKKAKKDKYASVEDLFDYFEEYSREDPEYKKYLTDDWKKVKTADKDLVEEKDGRVEKVRNVLRLKVAYVKHIPGHKNSKGEPAPWCVVSHKTGKIISSHKTKEEAEKHLKQIQMFKHMKKKGLSVKDELTDAIEALYDFLESGQVDLLRYAKDIVEGQNIVPKDIEIAIDLFEKGEDFGKIAQYVEKAISDLQRIRGARVSVDRESFRKVGFSDKEIDEFEKLIREGRPNEYVSKDIFEDLLKEYKELGEKKFRENYPAIDEEVLYGLRKRSKESIDKRAGKYEVWVDGELEGEFDDLEEAKRFAENWELGMYDDPEEEEKLHDVTIWTGGGTEERKIVGESFKQAGKVQELIDWFKQKIEEVKPDKDKMLEYAKKFLQKVKDLLVSVGRYTKEQINEYLKNYGAWAAQMIGVPKLVTAELTKEGHYKTVVVKNLETGEEKEFSEIGRALDYAGLVGWSSRDYMDVLKGGKRVGDYLVFVKEWEEGPAREYLIVKVRPNLYKAVDNFGNVLAYGKTEEEVREEVERLKQAKIEPEIGDVHEWRRQFMFNLFDLIKKDLDKAKEWVRKNWEFIEGKGKEWKRAFFDILYLLKEPPREELLEVVRTEREASIFDLADLIGKEVEVLEDGKIRAVDLSNS